MREKLQALMEKINPYIGKFSENKYLQAISASMMSTLGPIMLGSICILILVLSNIAAPGMLDTIGFTPVLSAANSVTIGALALYLAFLIAKNLTVKFLPEDDGVTAGIIALMSFLIVTPMGKLEDGVVAIPTTWLGAQGVFSAMIIAMVAGRIYVFFRRKKITIKMPDSVPPMVTKMFEALLPSISIGILFVIVSRIFLMTPFGHMHQFIYAVIQQPLKGLGGSIGAVIFLSLLQQLLWLFGIHGTNVVMPLVSTLWLSMDAENLSAMGAGQVPPNIVGYAFFCVITWGGMALGLVILMLFSKSKQYRQLGKVAIVPALFGITEPVIFGTPLVLNFDLAIPFVFNNSIALLLTYVLTNMGLVSRFMGTAPIFGLPVGVYAAIQGSVSIILIHLFIQLILSPVLWYPWFKRVEKRAILAEQSEA